VKLTNQANLPYVLWVAAFNSTFLLGYLIIETLVVPPHPVSTPCPPLLEAINKNSLPLFLAANLLTGVVNISMRTMYAKWYTSLGVLVAYSGGLCGLAWTLRRWSLKI
jgi:phosphatidylinositol glycan class W